MLREKEIRAQEEDQLGGTFPSSIKSRLGVNWDFFFLLASSTSDARVVLALQCQRNTTAGRRSKDDFNHMNASFGA